jgi:hypothetical protein
MLVNARVRNVLADGLLVSFLTFFNGTVDGFHLSQVLLMLLRAFAFLRTCRGGASADQLRSKGCVNPASCWTRQVCCSGIQEAALMPLMLLQTFPSALPLARYP